MKSHLPKIQFAVILLLLAAVPIGSRNQTKSDDTPFSVSQDEGPFNIILMIGDGMGPEHVKLGRWVEVGPNGRLVMEQLPFSANVTTYSADSNVTDSSAAATAMATGVKTNNGFVAIDPDNTTLETILEIAQSFGRATGVVTTTTIQHGTPASFMTHVQNRNNFSEITRQIIESANVDVLLGGGNRYFSDDQIDAMVAAGYTYVDNRSEMHAVSVGKVLGLFSYGHMADERYRDYDRTPSLAEMTSKSIEILSQDPQGFFLMIEGGKIDHAAHSNHKADTALELIAFDNAVEVALQYVSSHPNTILIVTADHETGGLSIIDQNLNETLPSSRSEESDRRQLRIERAFDVAVDFANTSHSATNVPLYWTGDVFNESISIIDNTGIFDAIHTYILNTSDDIITEPPLPLAIPIAATIIAAIAVVIVYIRRTR
ncbi:MAG: alkaline phosphatase [Candidatus Thorarchaeota archaeon]|jgi:alkaline phosphatase